MKKLGIAAIFISLCVITFVSTGCSYKHLLPRGPALTPDATVSAGTGHFVMTAYKNTDRKRIRVWTHRPEDWQAGDQVLFVMHGMSRNAKDYLDAWLDIADQKNILIIAPEFHNKFYKYTTIDYQDGNLFGLFGEKNPREEWAFQVIDNIIEKIESDNDFRIEKYDMFGHSGGGQFVHRMVLFYPDERLNIAIAANAGVYSFSDTTGDYPYTLPKGYSLSAQAIEKKLIVLVGEQDTATDTGSLDVSKAALRQGANRLERGGNFFNAGQSIAKAENLDFAWSFQVVPDVGHDFMLMTEAAADLL
ncbi:MAG: hypothetical protein AAFX04_07525 [Pseudomonadota bacterium]